MYRIWNVIVVTPKFARKPKTLGFKLSNWHTSTQFFSMFRKRHKKMIISVVWTLFKQDKMDWNHRCPVPAVQKGLKYQI